MNDEQFAQLVADIAKSDPAQREQWASQQPPLIESLDPADGDDADNAQSLALTPA
jgi:hypothetical protein